MELSVEERAKALRRIARRGGFEVGADDSRLYATHGEDLRAVVGRLPHRATHDLIEGIIDHITEDPLDGEADILRALRPTDPSKTLTQVREEQAALEGVNVKTIERREMKGAISFIHRVDELRQLPSFSIDGDVREKAIQDDTIYMLTALVRELVRDNPEAIARVEGLWAKMLSGAGSLSGKRIYGPSELFDDVLGNPDLDDTYSPFS